MKIVKANQAGIKQAVEILTNGGVVVYPTDTAYALGGVFNSAKAIGRILKIKQRQDRKFSLVCSSLSQVEKFFKLNKEEKKLVRKYWPGPLSITVGRKFSVRVPNNRLARELASQVGRPLIATSANISGREAIYDSKKIIKEFSNKQYQPDLIIDAGKLRKVKPSTLVKVRSGGVEVLREGPVKI